MAKGTIPPLSENTIWLIGGSLTVLLAAGIWAYMYLVMAKVLPVTVQPTKYDLAVVKNEMTVTDKNQSTNVYARASQLNTVPSGSSDATSYSQDQIGKTDITQFGH